VEGVRTVFRRLRDRYTAHPVDFFFQITYGLWDSVFFGVPCGYFSSTRFSCSHMVVKTILYCTRKCDSCKAGCMSASCLLQPPRNGSTCEVPVLEHETVSRILLNFLKDSPRNTFYMHEVFLGQSKRKFHVPGRGPDQLNRCEVAAESSLLTCSCLCSHISWYNTIWFVP